MDKSYESHLSAGVEKKYRELEMRIMQDVVRRISESKKITSTADWQLNRYRILGNSSLDIEKLVRSTVGGDYVDTFALYDRVLDELYVRSKELYEQVNEDIIPFGQNEELKQLTDALIQQSNDELYNITKSAGFKVDMGNGRTEFFPLADYYNQYLDAAMMDIATGAFDYNSTLRRVVTQMTNSGLRTTEYASGRTARCDVAARRAIMTGLSQLTGRVSDMNAKKLGTDHFEIAWHAGARPTHREWQGKVWSRQELYDVCGLGTVTGLLGVNCYHEYYPFIPGVSKRMYSDEWLEEQNRKEDIPKTFKGKEYTLYEATQRQRYMETCMRAQREKVQLLQQGGADPKEVVLVRCKYQAQLDEYKAFSKKMGLKEQRERIYYDMRGRVAPTREQYEAWKESQAEKKTPGARSLFIATHKPVYFSEKNDYSIRIEGYSDKVNAGLSEAAYDVAKRGSKDRKEHMWLVDLKSGKLYNHEVGDEGSVGYTFYSFAEEHKNSNYAFVHSHNFESSLSEADLITPATIENIPIQIAVQNDGVKYIAIRRGPVTENLYTDERYKDALKELNALSRQGLISPAERTHERERIVVECMLKEFFDDEEVMINGKRDD